MYDVRCMMYDVFGRIGKEGKWSLYRKRAASHSSETARLNGTD
jgi:hypothetical protein